MACSARMSTHHKCDGEPITDSKVHGANMGPSGADMPHVGPMDFAICDGLPTATTLSAMELLTGLSRIRVWLFRLILDVFTIPLE